MIDTSLIFSYKDLILEGIKNTFLISISSSCIGFALGLFLALLEEYAGKVAKIIVQFYVTIIRGTPMLIQILGAYYILPMIGIHTSGLVTAIIAIGLNSGAYISQVVKSGISAVSVSQVEAAHVLGFTPLQTARHIVFPQAIRTIFPSLSNEFITLIKDSSLASTIGVTELTKQGRTIISSTYDAISVFVLLACIYLIITTVLSYALYLVERRMKQVC